MPPPSPPSPSPPPPSPSPPPSSPSPPPAPSPSPPLLVPDFTEYATAKRCGNYKTPPDRVVLSDIESLDECAAQCLEQAGALNCDFFSYGGTYGGVLEAGKICLFNKDDGGCQNQIENSGSGWTTYKITPPPIYTLMNDALSWGDANAACLAAGLQLATVESAAQNALLVTVAAGNTVWIGGTDAASEGTWLWSPSNTLLSYFNWAAREPNGLTHENCLVAYSSGTWNDDGCTKKKKYACQLPIY